MAQNVFLDEKIIAMINQAENPETMPAASQDNSKEIPPEERTIYTGIKIDGQWIDFEERLFMDDKVSMMVPKTFKEMDVNAAKIKYPMEKRPKTILTDYTGLVNIVFNLIDTPTNNESMATIRDGLFSLMHRVNPGLRMQSSGDEVVDNKDIAYVEFTNPVLDGKLYNLMFYLDVGGKPLMVSFNCLTKSIKYWKSPALEMMHSIKVLTPKDAESPQGSAIDQ